MNLPSEVKVGACVFAVLEQGLLPEKHGTTEIPEARILIDRRQAESMKRDTLVHEVLHVILAVSGGNDALRLTDASEERLVRVLTPWLLGLIRDNPSLIGYLTT